MSIKTCSDLSYPDNSNTLHLNRFPSLDINKEQILQRTILSLESERDDLLSQVADLRQLIKRLSQQQETESQRKLKIHQDYQRQIKDLERALNTSEAHSAHLSNLKEFWNEFVN